MEDGSLCVDDRIFRWRGRRMRLQGLSWNEGWIMKSMRSKKRRKIVSSITRLSLPLIRLVVLSTMTMQDTIMTAKEEEKTKESSTTTKDLSMKRSKNTTTTNTSTTLADTNTPTTTIMDTTTTDTVTLSITLPSNTITTTTTTMTIFIRTLFFLLPPHQTPPQKPKRKLTRNSR